MKLLSRYFVPALFCAVLAMSTSTARAVIDNTKDWTVTAQNEIAHINKQLQQFDSKEDNSKLLGKLDAELATYISKAQVCVDEIMPQAEKLKADIAGLSNADTTNGSARDARSAFDRLAMNTEQQLQTCQAILVNAQNLSSNLHTLQASLLADFLLSRGDTALTTLNANLQSLEPVIASSNNFIQTRVQIKELSTVQWLTLVISMIVAWLAGATLRKRMLLRASAITSDTITDGLIAACYACIGRSLPLVLSSSAACVVLAATLPLHPLPVSTAIFASFVAYLLTIVSARIILHPCEPAKHFLDLNAHFAASLYKRLQFLLILGLFAVFAFATNLKQVITLEQWQLVRAIFMSLTIINLVWLIFYLNRAPGLLGSSLLRSLVSIALIIALVAEFSGLRNLSAYLFKGVLGSIMLGVGLWLVYALLHDTLDSLDEGRHRWEKKLRSKLRLKKNQPIPGILWIRMLSVLLVWVFFAISMLQLWRYSDSGWVWFLQIINNGFTIGSFRIAPLQIAFGIALFAVLLTFVRWFRQDTLPKWVRNTNLDHGGREAVVTISGYVGVLLAALIGLSIAGFDFTSLAIIAGALSVGIGFGLQNIVNNFVSGIILLFERPIRTGDWIVVGNTEGYVRKISIRSTQIETFDRADVIVPNSELISTQVTNWMLHDSWGRVIIPIGVAYGSDVRKVEKILIECASEHSLVIKESTRVNPPRVIFRGFGDSSLNFELRCFISQVDSRLSTLSDLNFAIEKALRDNEIEIPFPQRDLHLRSVDPSITLTSKKPEQD